MNDDELGRMLRQAAAARPAGLPQELGSSIMERVRTDTGRARRWRVFVIGLIAAAVVAGVAVALAVGWSLASRDPVHTRPPSMSLFRGGQP